MQLGHQRHLAYCTNVHRGETWAETLRALEEHTLAVKKAVCPPGEPYGIGLRLSNLASQELAANAAMRDEFRRWLDVHGCYVFTVNGFPYGQFHATRVKEAVYTPDWTTRERLEYTCRLFDLLAEWLPAGVGGSVSSVPGGYKGLAAADSGERAAQTDAMCRNLRLCGEHVQRVSERTGHVLALALEPEPLCWFENTSETIGFFARLGPGLPIGVCFDTCHFAVEFEESDTALQGLTEAGILISKLHLSSAVCVVPTPANRTALQTLLDPVYLHQTLVQDAAGRVLFRWADLDTALHEAEAPGRGPVGEEWRVHFHVPLHQPPTENLRVDAGSQLSTVHRPPSTGLGTTSDAVLSALDWLVANPAHCPHLEMETYTWEVLPEAWRTARVEEQISREYAWTLARLRERGLLRVNTASPVPSIRPAGPPSRLRTWLVLSRGSNLPTVWSNCLAGWWLGGARLGGEGGLVRAALLLLGASLLYTAGMWLNDAHDAEWDAAHRPERPIPAGLVSRRAVSRAGVAALLLGTVCLWPLGLGAVFWTAILIVCIEGYNRVHKHWPHASWLMAACRFCLYPLGASVGGGGNAFWPLWGGLFLALYIAGITYLARGESLPARRGTRLPWVWLAAPVLGWAVLSWATQWPPFWNAWLLLPFGLWLHRAWRRTTPGRPPVADLLAGIVLVDLAFTPPATVWRIFVLGAFFFAARWFQCTIPAT